LRSGIRYTSSDTPHEINAAEVVVGKISKERGGEKKTIKRRKGEGRGR